MVSEGVNRVRESGDVGTLLITHYTRILRYITPDFVHVMAGGRIVDSGGAELADEARGRGLRAVRGHGGRMSADLAAEAKPDRRLTTTDWPYDVEKVRADFPILTRRIHDGVPLVYLDSAATSQKPLAVLDAEREYNERHNANVHRGIHTLAEEATALYEGAREKVATFLGATDPREIIFTKNITEGLNLLAHSIGAAPAARRRGRRHRDGAPLQSRAVAACLRALRRDAALVRADRRRPARPRGR